jgi:enamine deaminase RidA (YjgF/YER057c/UK114 family)|tara:strand:- start:225 stop:653 length:429 start_codon:yes stop_codon:yes gene_type:complete
LTYYSLPIIGAGMSRERINTGTPFEQVAGFSRAIRVGQTVHVSGTTATDQEGRVLAKGDAAEQTRITLQLIQKALVEAGSSRKDVVRTRMYAVNENDCYRIMRAHGDFFKEVLPATTLVVVKSLVDPEMLIEVEAMAVISRN